MRIRNRDTADVVRLPLSPMIDIIFLLLIFFVMTFQIVPLEGNLSINMPQASAGEPRELIDLPVQPPLHLRLTANADGSLSSIRLGDTPYDSFAALNQQIRQLVPTDEANRDHNWEAIIEADHDLAYLHTIAAIDALSGYKNEQGRTVELIGKIRFSQPAVR